MLFVGEAPIMTSAKELWGRYLAWLKEHVPFAHANLAGPASPEEIAEVERVTGHALPEGIKEVWRMTNGQKQTMIASTTDHAMVCIPTLSFLSTDLAIAIWREWDHLRRTDRGIDKLQTCGSSPEEGVVQPLYTHPGWIPLWSDPTRADFIGVDLAPGEKGTRGQIINFGRDEEEHHCLAPSFEDLLQILIDEVESGAWPATECQISKDQKAPWFGDPKEHFFNALNNRWMTRLPPDPRELLRQAKTALQDGDPDRASELLAQVRRMGVKEGGISCSLEAKICEAQERWRDAEVAWARTNEVAPKLAVHWKSRCDNLVHHLHAYQEAEEVAIAALKNFPDDEVFVLARARIAYLRGDYATALIFRRRYAELKPKNLAAKVNYAWALGATGNAAEAVALATTVFNEAGAGQGDVAVEAAYYVYALANPNEQPAWLGRLRTLLDAGTTTKDWNFAPIIATAIAAQHPEAKWLSRLAEVANGVATVDQLAPWPAWMAAKT